MLKDLSRGAICSSERQSLSLGVDGMRFQFREGLRPVLSWKCFTSMGLLILEARKIPVFLSHSCKEEVGPSPIVQLSSIKVCPSLNILS